MTKNSATWPVRLESTTNLRDAHWSVRSRRTKKIRGEAAMLVRASLSKPTGFPVLITLTRIAPRPLDVHDGLPYAFKPWADAIAEDWLGMKDNDPRLRFAYAQRRGGVRQYGVEVTVERADPLKGIDQPWEEARS